MELDAQGDADRLYADAIEALVRIQSGGARACGTPAGL